MVEILSSKYDCSNLCSFPEMMFLVSDFFANFSEILNLIFFLSKFDIPNFLVGSCLSTSSGCKSSLKNDCSVVGTFRDLTLSMVFQKKS